RGERRISEMQLLGARAPLVALHELHLRRLRDDRDGEGEQCAVDHGRPIDAWHREGAPTVLAPGASSDDARGRRTRPAYRRERACLTSPPPDRCGSDWRRVAPHFAAPHARRATAPGAATARVARAPARSPDCGATRPPTRRAGTRPALGRRRPSLA